MTDRRAPILIAGAGLAGLTAALMLAKRGVPCLAVDRREALSGHPRAHGVNLRSMELFRQIPGLEADLRSVCRAAPDDETMLIAETVTGHVIKTLRLPGGFDWRSVSPAMPCSVGQDRIEPVLLRHARALGADIRFSTELVSFAQEGDHVRAVLRDATNGDETVVLADYLFACDGSGSRIRRSLDIHMDGNDGISHAVSILFEADLETAIGKRGFLLCYIRNEELTGAFVTCDDPRLGQLNVQFDPAHENTSDFDVERCARLVRSALGLPNLAIDIIDAMPWRMSALLADRMRVGRVFLVGDAAHIIPPVGGLGGQTAIQDAADLAWKTAMTLNGHAGPALLDTYETERRPVARLAIARATENYVQRLRPDRTELSSSHGQVKIIDLVMSYRYRSPAISLEESDDGLPTEDVLCPTGRSGTRLAHVWLRRDDVVLSTHDLVGSGFVLLAGPAGAAWADAADVLTSAGVPLTAFRIGVDLFDHDDLFLVRTGLEPDGALLVRPDGFIAWRSRYDRDDRARMLADAIARALCLCDGHRGSHATSRLVEAQ